MSGTSATKSGVIAVSSSEDVTVTSASSSASSASGDIAVSTGMSASTSSGLISVSSGHGTTSSETVKITTGDANMISESIDISVGTSNEGGDILLSPGTGAGNVTVQSGMGGVQSGFVSVSTSSVITASSESGSLNMSTYLVSGICVLLSVSTSNIYIYIQ